MSYKAYFTFAQGISSTIKVPVGAKNFINLHIETVENSLSIEREKYLDNPVHWKWNKYETVTDKELCEIAEDHNNFVRHIYDSLAEWSENPPELFEEVTNEEFQEWLPALSFITVKPERWTGEYYTQRMQSLYEVMRGRDDAGVSFGAKKLTERQASEVVWLFSEFLDTDDRRLEVPKGQDYLASSYDGGYEWCETCGAITYEDSLYCNKRKCALKKQRKEDEE